MAIAAVIGGCTGQLAGDTPGGAIPTTGNAFIVPVVPNGLGGVQFNFTIGGHGIDAITGTIDASPLNGAGALVSDLPPGGGYVVTISEPLGCVGGVHFTVEAAKTTAVNVPIACPQSRGRNTIIPGTLDQCPFITSVSPPMDTATLGVPVAIAVSAQDLDAGDVVSYTWSETASPPLGTFADATAANTTFTCATTGTTTLSIAVSDGICGDAAAGAITLNCLAPAGD